MSLYDSIEEVHALTFEQPALKFTQETRQFVVGNFIVPASNAHAEMLAIKEVLRRQSIYVTLTPESTIDVVTCWEPRKTKSYVRCHVTMDMLYDADVYVLGCRTQNNNKHWNVCQDRETLPLDFGCEYCKRMDTDTPLYFVEYDDYKRWVCLECLGGSAHPRKIERFFQDVQYLQHPATCISFAQFQDIFVHADIAIMACLAGMQLAERTPYLYNSDNAHAALCAYCYARALENPNNLQLSSGGDLYENVLYNPDLRQQADNILRVLQEYSVFHPLNETCALLLRRAVQSTTYFKDILWSLRYFMNRATDRDSLLYERQQSQHRYGVDQRITIDCQCIDVRTYGRGKSYRFRDSHGNLYSYIGQVRLNLSLYGSCVLSATVSGLNHVDKVRYTELTRPRVVERIQHKQSIIKGA